jgi:hypothetical protein
MPTATAKFESFAPALIYARNAIDKFAAARLPKDPGDPTRPSRMPPILGNFTFLVKQRISPAPVIYAPPLEFITQTNPSGFVLQTGETRSASSALVRALAPGRYVWRLEADFYQPLEFEDDWPPSQIYDQSKDLQLLPGPAYPFPDLTLKQRELVLTLVRGSLFTVAGMPQQDATVELLSPVLSNSFVTFSKSVPDTQGNWVIPILQVQPEDPAPDFAHAAVRFTFSGGLQSDVSLAITPGAENFIRQTALRGRVIQSGGLPVAAAAIGTSISAGSSLSGSVGQWAYYFGVLQNDSPATVTAVAPDGRRAQQTVQVLRGKTLILPTMQVA